MKRTINTLTLYEEGNTQIEDYFYFNFFEDSLFEPGHAYSAFALRKLQYEIMNLYKQESNNNGYLQTYLDENWYHLNRMDENAYYIIKAIETEEIELNGTEEI